MDSAPQSTTEESTMHQSTYTAAEIIRQRKALAERLFAAGHNAIASSVTQRLGLAMYTLIEDGESYDRIWAASAQEAVKIAGGNVDGSNYDVSTTLWIDVEARNAINSNDAETATVTLEPDEPDCEDGHSHNWKTPYSVLGGLEENPGVWGHGGGVIMHSVCAHCGIRRKVDTWAQRRDTGEQGMTSIGYEPADEDSLAWVRSLQEDEEARSL